MIPFLPGGTEFVSGGALLIVFGAALAYFRNVPGKLFRLFERWFITVVDIQEEDESFQWMKLWLSRTLEGSRSVSVFTRRPKAAPEWEDDVDKFKYVQDDNEDKRPRIVFTPAPGWYWFFYKGTLVTMNRNRTEPEGKGGSSDSGMKPRESLTLRIFSRNIDIAKQIVEEARDFALPKDGKVEIRTCGQGSYWNLTGRIRPRPIESVVLEEGTSEQVLADVKRFQKSGEWYTKLGVPYRRGYLLYGSPGNGKSSFVLAVASELGMNVNVLSLSSPGMNDGKIIELLGSVDTNTIVLIEDIDCAFVKRNPGTDRKKGIDFGLTFSGVLNALDGIMAQDGRIVFMTTNHPEKLDAALTRPGRADVKVYIGDTTPSQAYRLFLRFYPDANPKLAERFAAGIGEKTSMAKLQHHLMSYRDDSNLAVDKMSELQKEEQYESQKAA